MNLVNPEPVNPVNEPNVEGLLNRWFDAADNREDNPTVKDKLYADTKQVASNITQLIRDGRTEEAKKLADTILNSFDIDRGESPDKTKLDSPNRLVGWISKNSTNEGDKVIGDKLEGAHKYFHGLFSTLKRAEGFSHASERNFKSTIEMFDQIDVLAKDFIPEKTVNIAAISDDIWILGSYAEAKIKPFFEIVTVDSQPKVNLFGSVQSPKGGTVPVPLQKKHYEDSVRVSEYFHDFMKERVAKKDLTLESALNILLDLNDQTGIQIIITSKKDEFLDEKALDVDKILKMGPNYVELFIDYLLDNTLQYCFNQAQINGDIDTQALLISKKIPVTSEQKELYERQKNWFEKLANDQIPALKYYNAERQIFDQKHNVWYTNNNKGQKFYIQETEKSVKFALFMMNEWKNSKDGNNHKFESLLTSLGFRRGSIAYQSESMLPEQFGKKRGKFHAIQIERYGQAYEDRIKDLMDHQLSGASVTVNGLRVGLAKYITVGDLRLSYHNQPFWSPDDPVFGLVSNLFDSIINMENVSLVGLQSKIAEFHWLMANIIPFDRGSASITEVLTDALWLMHGFVPQRNLEKGKTIDMEAILAASFNSFVKDYPFGMDYHAKVDYGVPRQKDDIPSQKEDGSGHVDDNPGGASCTIL